MGTRRLRAGLSAPGPERLEKPPQGGLAGAGTPSGIKPPRLLSRQGGYWLQDV